MKCECERYDCPQYEAVDQCRVDDADCEDRIFSDVEQIKDNEMITVEYENGLTAKTLIEQLEVMESHDVRIIGCNIKCLTQSGNFIDFQFPDKAYIDYVDNQHS